MRMKGGNRDQKTLVTTYYRGSLVRTHMGDQVRISDSKTGVVTILSLKDKTFRTVRLADVFARFGKSSKRKMRFSAKISRKNQQKRLLGRTAHLYAGTGKLSMIASTPGAVEQPVMKILIQQWASPAVRLPSASVALGLAALPGIGGGLAGNKELVREMGKIKGFPMISHFEFVPEKSSASRVIMDSVVSRIVEAPLNPSLFRVPTGFRNAGARSLGTSAPRTPHS